MNYEETRQALLMRIAEMYTAFQQHGLEIRDDYTLDDALAFSGMRLLEITDTGYEAMLQVLSSRSHVDRCVCDGLQFLDKTFAMTVPALRKLITELSVMSNTKPSISNITIRYTVLNTHRRRKPISAANITADVNFDMPDAPVEWHIPSANDVDASVIPNISKARQGDTVINSPSDQWQLQVNSVMLLSLLSECFMRAGLEQRFYFHEVDEGCYVISSTPENVYSLSKAIGLDFFPVPDPEFDDELYEREADEEEAAAEDVNALAEQAGQADEVDEDEGEGAPLDFEFPANGFVFSDELPEIADAPVTEEDAPEELDESDQIDPELLEQLVAENKEPSPASEALQQFGARVRRMLMTPGKPMKLMKTKAKAFRWISNSRTMVSLSATSCPK